MAVSIFFFSLRRESPHFMSFFAKWIEKWLLALTIYHGQIDCSLHKNVNSLVIAEVFCGVRNHGETGKYIYIYIYYKIYIYNGLHFSDSTRCACQLQRKLFLYKKKMRFVFLLRFFDQKRTSINWGLYLLELILKLF